MLERFGISKLGAAGARVQANCACTHRVHAHMLCVHPNPASPPNAEPHLYPKEYQVPGPSTPIGTSPEYTYGWRHVFRSSENATSSVSCLKVKLSTTLSELPVATHFCWPQLGPHKKGR